MSTEQLKALGRFSACDIADALLKLKVPHAGFIPDLHLLPSSTSDRRQPVYAPISTVLFAPKPHNHPTYLDIEQDTNIPTNAHYVDHTPSQSGQLVLISAPPDVSCAVLGGIMALRMHVNGASGIIVHGRVRDLAELKTLGIPVWSRGTSVVGAGEGTKVWAREVPLVLGDVRVSPGDIVCADPEEQGVVVIPRDLAGKVLELCPKLTEADEKVVEDVKGGGTVKEAFAKHRGNL